MENDGAEAELFPVQEERGTAGGASPLASRMRPRCIEEFIGQEHIMGEGKVLRTMMEKDALNSLILWGPPGSGKTTIAMIMARMTGSDFVSFSAVTSGIKDIRRVVKRAEENRILSKRRTVLFCDEIHRFNKSQQDAFLPHVEDGSIILVGATTENPSFEVNSPLLSRSRVFVLKPLSPGEIKVLLTRALNDKERGLGRLGLELGDEVLDIIASSSDGDARRALNLLELSSILLPSGDKVISREIVRRALQRKHLHYDKAGEEHYNLISALHKSLRGGDPDASLYWLARMLEAGEDPLYIARRLVRFASEDIGLADAGALTIVVAARDAVHFIGLPEGDLALAEAVVYLATAPKSNAVYTAYSSAKRAVEEEPNAPVPIELRNAPTQLMKELGFGEGYKYPHDAPDRIVDQQYLPEGLLGRKFYHPTDSGREGEVRRRLERWWETRRSLEARRVAGPGRRSGEDTGGKGERK
jgi:putative ATPase